MVLIIFPMQNVAQPFRQQHLSLLKTLILDISVGRQSEVMSSALTTPFSQANTRSSTQSQHPESSTDVVQNHQFELRDDRNKLAMAMFFAIYHKTYSAVWFSGLMLLAGGLGTFNVRTISIIVAGALCVCTMCS